MTNLHRMPETSCPRCGQRLTGAGSFDNDPRPPKPGDFTICIQCHEFLTFRDDMVLRALDDAERAELCTMPELTTMLDMLLRCKRPNMH